MKRALTEVLSQRKYTHWPSFKIVYEWEDILAKDLGIPTIEENPLKFKFFRRFENNGLVEVYQFIHHKSNSLKLRFVMDAYPKKLCILDSDTIPAIIDFWLGEKDLPIFFEAYKHCPLVLITSAEVYTYLKEHNCPLPIEHWPLSYPDIYRMRQDCLDDKQYEFCIFGRPNPFFIRLLDEYCEKHPDFTYIHSEGDISHRRFVDHHGHVIMKDTGRQSYLEMIRKTKISCYTTPGIDESKSITNQFNQVTPRLFEMLTNGCQVIGHYTDNPDTEYYKLPSIVPNVNDYEDFEKVLDKFRKETFDYSKISTYMEKQYTSTRSSMLESILKKHNIQIL